MKPTWRILATLVVVGAVLAGCGGEDDERGGERADEATFTGSFVGTVEGSNAYIAVVVGPEGSALAYVCDGAESVDLLDGGFEGNAASLANDGGAILEVTFADRGASGTFTRPGNQPLSFTAETADKPAGLYRAEESFADGLYQGGWVVLADGTQRGAVRRYETPLPPGGNWVLDLDNPIVMVPGGVLRPRFVDPITFR